MVMLAIRFSEQTSKDYKSAGSQTEEPQMNQLNNLMLLAVGSIKRDAMDNIGKHKKGRVDTVYVTHQLLYSTYATKAEAVLDSLKSA